MKAKTKTVIVELDASTWRWLRALARANSNSDMHAGVVTDAELLAQAAFCFADAAGRRPGSWEASVGQSLLVSSGFQREVTWPDRERCYKFDAREQAAWRAKWEANHAADATKPPLGAPDASGRRVQAQD